MDTVSEYNFEFEVELKNSDIQKILDIGRILNKKHFVLYLC